MLRRSRVAAARRGVGETQNGVARPCAICREPRAGSEHASALAAADPPTARVSNAAKGPLDHVVKNVEAPEIPPKKRRRVYRQGFAGASVRALAARPGNCSQRQRDRVCRAGGGGTAARALPAPGPALRLSPQGVCRLRTRCRLAMRDCTRAAGFFDGGVGGPPPRRGLLRGAPNFAAPACEWKPHAFDGKTHGRGLSSQKGFRSRACRWAA
jgi:hypothetical protein